MITLQARHEIIAIIFIINVHQKSQSFHSYRKEPHETLESYFTDELLITQRNVHQNEQ